MTITNMNLPTVAAFGEWSQTNIGDHAIHEGVQAFFEDCGWRVRSFDIGALRPASGARLGAAASAAERQARNWLTLSSVPSAKRVLRGLRQQLLIKRLLPDLSRCDAICVGGGALLTDVNLHFPQSLEALTWAARQLDKPLLCLGCSAEEDWSPRGREIVRDFLAACSFIAVRDRASSVRIARALGTEVPVFGDFALRLSPDGETRRRDTQRYELAVNVTHVPAPHTERQSRYEDGVVELVTQTIAHKSNVGGIVIFTTGTAQDVEPATRVWRRLAPYGAQLHLGRSLNELRAVLRSSKAIVAARLHAAIIPLAETLPVFGYSATPKLGNFFETMGLRACYFSPSDPMPMVVGQLLEMLESPDRFLATPNAEIERTRDRARRFLSTLNEILPLQEAASQ